MGSGAVALIPLQGVSAQLRVGAALPWAVRDPNGKLLLARGQLLRSEATLAALVIGLRLAAYWVDRQSAENPGSLGRLPLSALSVAERTFKRNRDGGWRTLLPVGLSGHRAPADPQCRIGAGERLRSTARTFVWVAAERALTGEISDRLEAVCR